MSHRVKLGITVIPLLAILILSDCTASAIPAATKTPSTIAASSTQVPPLTTEGSPEKPEESGTGEGDDLAAFEDQVRKAVIQREEETMAQLMGDPFAIGWWQSEGVSLSPAEAAAELAMGWLIPGNPVAFVNDLDLTGMLNGLDPLTMWGPDIDARSALFCTGWGSNASSEAVLVIAWDDTIGYYWHAVLIAPEGFAQTGDNLDFRGQFEQEVMQAIINHDFEAMIGLMSNPFQIALWQSQGKTLPPAEAIEQIKMNYPPESFVISYSEPQPDLNTLLGGNPIDFFGGGISFLHSVGWGESGTGEAVVVIDANEDGALAWSMILFAPNGLAP